VQAKATWSMPSSDVPICVLLEREPTPEILTAPVS